MVRFIVFRDWDIFHYWPFNDVPWNQPNKFGYLTDDNVVIYPYIRWIRKVKLHQIRKPYKIATMPPDLPEGPGLEAFFTRNVLNPELFNHGMHVMKREEPYLNYLDNPIKLPILDPIDEAEFERRWRELISVIRDGDILLCINTESRISRFIAWFDQGVWSHTATYMGDKYVAEAITSGVVMRPLEVYHHYGYRFGVYRPNHTPDSLRQAKEFILSTLGDRYSYKKVFQTGLRKLFGRKPRMPWVTPNEAVVITNFPLLYVV
jgi:hypothetical protein